MNNNAVKKPNEIRQRSAAAIQQGTGPVTLRSLDDAFKTTREKFLKAKRKNKEASSAERMKAFGDKIQSSNISTNNRKRVYNPQEKY